MAMKVGCVSGVKIVGRRKIYNCFKRGLNLMLIDLHLERAIRRYKLVQAVMLDLHNGTEQDAAHYGAASHEFETVKDEAEELLNNLPGESAR